MKYLRTRHGVYGAISENEAFITVIGRRTKRPYPIYRNDPRICEDALHDTIEEACDLFVEEGFGTHRIVDIQMIEEDDDALNYDVYGAIWTEKGLIYVAKMNERREFELL